MNWFFKFLILPGLILCENCDGYEDFTDIKISCRSDGFDVMVPACTFFNLGYKKPLLRSGSKNYF